MRSHYSDLRKKLSFECPFQTLCEKGLVAMESSHRRIINDLEEKHRQEIQRLLCEKEQALAEETQVQN